MNDSELLKNQISSENQSFITSKNLFEPLVNLDTPIFDKFPGDSDGLLFSGVGSLIDPDNQFVFPILRAEASTVSVTDLNISEDIPSKVSAVSGEQLALISGFQSRYNNRATISGSMGVCSD